VEDPESLVFNDIRGLQFEADSRPLGSRGLNENIQQPKNLRDSHKVPLYVVGPYFLVANHHFVGRFSRNLLVGKWLAGFPQKYTH